MGGGVAAVEFEAEVRQVKTMVNGTVNVTFNLPEYCIPQAQEMIGWIGDMVRCVVATEAKGDGFEEA